MAEVPLLTLKGRFLHAAGIQRALAHFLIATLICLALPVPSARAATAVPPGVWLFDGKVAIQIYKCKSRLCGRILWLEVPRDAQGALDVDKNNPVPALRTRRLSGLTIIRGLKALGKNRWDQGTFYNPDDGRTYSLSAELVSDNKIVARVFIKTPALGQTKTLTRVVRRDHRRLVLASPRWRLAGRRLIAIKMPVAPAR